MRDKLTVLVATCDKYQFLWKNFSKCYEKYFPYKLDTLFIGETVINPDYPTFLPNRRSSWGKRVRESLAFVKTPHVLFLLEDYFLSFDYGADRLCKYLRDMDSYGMNRLQISRSSSQVYIGTNDIYLKFHPQSENQFSLQPAIWRKDWLEKNLSDEFTPWDLDSKVNESDGESGGIPTYPDTLSYIDPTINFPVYFNAVRTVVAKSEGWDQFKLKQGLEEF